MSKTLTANDYIWEVYCDAADDGLPVGCGYFSSHKLAQEFMDKGKYHGIRQVTLYKDSANNYYSIPYINDVYVDLPDKQEVLKKLTKAERIVLGLK